MNKLHPNNRYVFSIWKYGHVWRCIYEHLQTIEEAQSIDVECSTLFHAKPVDAQPFI